MECDTGTLPAVITAYGTIHTLLMWAATLLVLPRARQTEKRVSRMLVDVMRLLNSFSDGTLYSIVEYHLRSKINNTVALTVTLQLLKLADKLYDKIVSY